MRRSRLLLLLTGLLLSLLYCPPVDMLVDDKVIFHYAGFLIARGKVPYLDLFDHKPPLIYFLNYAGLLLGPWGLWIIDTLLVAVASLFFYERCVEKQLSFPILLPLFFNLLIRNYLVCHGIGMTRAYTAILLLIAFCLVLGRARYLFFWLGLIIAATFLMQQDQVLPLLPLLAYAFVANHSDRRMFLARLAQHIAGFLLFCAPIFLYLALHHALTAFWQDAFLFNFQWYAQRSSFGEQFRAIHNGLKESDLIMPLIVGLTLAITALLLRAKEKLLVYTALLTTLLAFGPELFSARLVLRGPDFYYYFLPLSSALPILIFTAWMSTDHAFLRSKVSQAVFGFLVCVPLVYNAMQHATHLEKYGKDILVTPEYQFLAHQSLSDYQLYTFGNSNWVYPYDEFHLLAPSPWIYHHFWLWYPRWDSDHRILMSIEHDLLAHRTRYVLDFSEPGTFADPSAYAWWQNFLRRYYEPIRLPDRPRVIIWQLKPAAINAPLSAGPPAS